MTVFGSLTTAVTGLTAQARSLGHLSDNISNSQTVGYKRVDSSFQNLVTQSNSSIHSPGGVRAKPQYTNDLQGTILQSDTRTHVAVSGNGFFQVSRGTDGTSAVSFQGAPIYTRAGDFSLDRFGHLRNNSGLFLNGWGINARTGEVEKGIPGPIRVSALIDNPTPTNNINLSANLPLTPPANSTLPPQTISIIDANGTSRDIQLNWRQQTQNNWRLSINAPGSTTSPVAGVLTGINDQAISAPIQTLAGVTAVSQISTSTFPAAVVSGTTYSVTLNGQTFSYRASATDTGTTVAAQVFNLVNASGAAPGLITPVANVLTFNGDAAGNAFTLTASPAAVTVATGTAAVLGVREQSFVPISGSAGDIGDVYTIPFTAPSAATISYTTDGTETSIVTIAERLAGAINSNSSAPVTAQVSGAGLILTAKTAAAAAVTYGGTLGATNGSLPPHVAVSFGNGGVISALNSTNVGTGNASVSPNQNSADPAFVSFTVNYGGGPQTIRLNMGSFGSSTGGLTQFAGTSIDVFALQQDGFTRGAFRELEVRSSGDIVANYDNGRSRTLARIPVFQVTSANQLQKVDGNAYVTTRESGTARADDPGANGAGSLVVSSLEGSNVDIAQEFTKMIITQRAYTANTKVVTTSDEMLTETLNMKR
jgi:flagellar hook protein FlgE